jgi:hypothetical protein
MAVRQSSIGRAPGWQNDAWIYYDRIGELRFGTQWIANAMSRVNLVAAMPPLGPGDEPTPIDYDDPRTTAVQRRAIEIVGSMANGATGQGQMLGSFGTHLTVAGIGWLVVEPDLDDPEADELADWNVYSSEEVRQAVGGDGIEIRTGHSSWRMVHPNAVVVKVWRRHPRANWEPDSPTRGVLNVLREIDMLSQHIHATAQSRLAGAGILAIPSEATFPPGQGPQTSQQVDPDDENTTAPEDGFVETLIDAMTTPLVDRGSAASVVPLVIKVPGDLVDKITHISFSTPFDDKVLDLMTGAIKRLALGLDIPPEILTGTSGMNHWGAWQVQEESITLHVEPLSEVVVNALTIGFLHPALEAEGFDPSEVMVWYDTSDLRTRPDRSRSAVEAYDRQELSGEAMLREMGLSVDDMPSEEEKREKILLSVVRSAPALAPAILPLLGYDIGSDDQPILVEATTDAPAAIPALDRAPDTRDALPASAGPDALVAACDIIVHRALERAGSRLRSAAGKKTPGGAAAIDCPDPARLHLSLDATEHADLTALLDGAWTLVPDVAARHSIDADALSATLDAYTRGLLAAGHGHDHGRLSAALGLTTAV